MASKRMGVFFLLASGLLVGFEHTQGSRTRVTYRVAFSTTGGLLDRNCAASGTDSLTGTLVGYEPADPNEPNVYVGRLTRRARISICGSRTNPATGTDVVCGMNIAVDDEPEVTLTIEPGQRDGYLEYISDRRAYSALLPTSPPPSAALRSSVTGSCDAAEMAQMEREFDKGQTGGSPSGQPIEVPSLPPPSYPFTFAARPPQSIWTLKVLSRTP